MDVSKPPGEAKNTAGIDEYAVVPTVSGISNLSNLVSALPMPYPRHRCSAGSLLHPKQIADDAAKILAVPGDSGLVTQLSDALSQTSMPVNLESLDHHTLSSSNGINVPKLLQSILDHNPKVFTQSSNVTCDQSTALSTKPDMVNGFLNHEVCPSIASTAPCPLPSVPQQATSSLKRLSVTINRLPTTGVQPMNSSNVVAGEESFNAVTSKRRHGSSRNASNPSSTVDIVASEPIAPAKTCTVQARQRRRQCGPVPVAPPCILTDVSPCILTDDSNFISAPTSETACVATVPVNVGVTGAENCSNTDSVTPRVRRYKRKSQVDEGQRIDSGICDCSVAVENCRSEPVAYVVKAELSLKRTVVILSPRCSAHHPAFCPSSNEQTVPVLPAEFDRRRCGVVTENGQTPVTLPADGALDPESVEHHVAAAGKQKYATVSRSASENLPESTGMCMATERGRRVSQPACERQQEVTGTKSKTRRRASSVDASEDTSTSLGLSRFNSLVESVFSLTQDMNLNFDFKAFDGDGDEAVFPKSPLGRKQLNELKAEVAKLKSMGAINQVSTSSIVRLLKILLLNIGNGCAVVEQIDMDGDDSDEDRQQWIKNMHDCILPAFDASLTAMYIMMSRDMPKEVFLEDAIEWTVKLVKTQLFGVVYPLYNSLKGDRKQSGSSLAKCVQLLYEKLTELTSLLSELVRIQMLTDTILLQLSNCAVSPFFVEDLSHLQLAALHLVSAVFSRYESHRQLILEDILSSLNCLPSSKKNLRTYRLNATDSVQMVSALVLQLIQSAIRLPDAQQLSDTKEMQSVVLKSYEAAIRTAQRFLTVFLSKCTSPKSKGDDDYRPLFENFVYDLLTMFHKPEWPAAELVLNILGSLLVAQASAKTPVEMSARIAALDYLGTIVSSLRRDALSMSLDQQAVDAIVSRILNEDSERSRSDSKITQPPGTVQVLQKALIAHLICNKAFNPASVFSPNFYLGQWTRDYVLEISRTSVNECDPPDPVPVQRKPNKRKPKRRATTDDVVDDEEAVNLTENGDNTETELQKMLQFVLGLVQSHQSLKQSYKLESEDLVLITRYLAAQRPACFNFDAYLIEIIELLAEKAIQVRTKALKCLTAIIEVDPTVLARLDVEAAVHGRFLDVSISVREAAIDLVGRFLVVQPELTAQYYSMLADRILDTGVSVRKRVLKIFRDVCSTQHDFDRIPEMCVKMICRIDDEEQVKKLVTETFQSLWFVPLNSQSEDYDRQITKRASMIIKVMTLSQDCEWFEQLLASLFKVEKEKTEKLVEMACEQIVKCLIEKFLGSQMTTTDSPDLEMAGSSSVLQLLCKAQPSLLVPYCGVIEPFLAIKHTNLRELQLINNIVQIMELTVPLVKNPSELFLSQLEENLMKLILECGSKTIQNCAQCLGAVINNVTHNYKLISDCFAHFSGVTIKMMAQDKAIKNLKQGTINQAELKRALFTVGVLCKVFNLHDMLPHQTEMQVCDRVFNVFLHFIGSPDIGVRCQALVGFGFLASRHSELMLTKQVRDLYKQLLTCAADTASSVRLMCHVLTNLQTYLLTEELKMTLAEAEWKKVHGTENLKEMNEVQSGMASTVVQAYLWQILESYFNVNTEVRRCVTEVVVLILRQGLINPIQCLSHVIAMSSDPDPVIRNKADQQLLENNKKNPTFIQVKSSQGIKMSYRLHELLQRKSSSAPVRGLRVVDGNETSINGSIYALTRVSRSHRRLLMTSLLNMFSDESVSLSQLLFVCDNFAYFAYQHLDEPLYLMHQIDVTVSISGSALLDSFREIFHPDSSAANQNKPSGDDDDDDDVDSDDEDEDSLLPMVTANISKLWDLHTEAQRYVLLLALKQFLKQLYGFTDSKLRQYSPTAVAKIYNKPLNRRSGVSFLPQQALDFIQHGTPGSCFNEQQKKKLVQSYLDFKSQMSKIDRGDDDEAELVAVDDVVVGDVETMEPQEGCDSTLNNTDTTDCAEPPDSTSRRRKPGAAVHRSASSTSSCNKSVQKRQKTNSKPAKRKRRRKFDECDSDDSGSDCEWK